jgi:hypothetical protein
MKGKFIIKRALYFLDSVYRVYFKSEKEDILYGEFPNEEHAIKFKKMMNMELVDKGMFDCEIK